MPSKPHSGGNFLRSDGASSNPTFRIDLQNVYDAPMDTRRGRLFVIAAPSGAGKTSLVKALLGRKPRCACRSRTPRDKRATEEHGREYYFVDRPTSSSELIGARRSSSSTRRCSTTSTAPAARPVEAQLARAATSILEIDWQGARQVRKAHARNATPSSSCRRPARRSRSACATARPTRDEVIAAPAARRGRRYVSLGRVRLRRRQRRVRARRWPTCRASSRATQAGCHRAT